MKPLSKLIIVDDETIIREGLRDMVDWEDLGYEVVGCFEDGKEAIQYIDENPVDVVLTDIMMDEVSGIDVTRNVSEHHPDIRVVILSGYREFEFAQKAIEYHASRYLLKPIDFDELAEAFAELKTEISGIPAEANAEMLSAAKRQLFVDAAAGRITTHDELQRRSSRLGFNLDLDTCPCEIVLFEISTSGNEHPAASVASGVLRSLSSAIDADHFETVASAGNRTVMLAMSGKPMEKNAYHTAFSNTIEQNVASIRSSFKVSVRVEYLGSYSGLSGILNTGVDQAINSALRLAGSPKVSETVHNQDPVLARVITYLEQNYSSDVSLSDAASRAYLSPVYFSRYFKDHTGIKFSDYLAKLRIDKAIHLLKDNSHKIQEVGKLVGYPNPRYFARVFKKTTGYSPRDYCMQVLAGEDAYD